MNSWTNITSRKFPTSSSTMVLPTPFLLCSMAGPEEDTSAHVLLIADTTATGVDPQIPGALSVLSSPAITYKTPYANGCPVTAPYGASLAITYQALDSSSQHAAIANSNMEPKEQTSSLVINGVARGSGPAQIGKILDRVLTRLTEVLFQEHLSSRMHKGSFLMLHFKNAPPIQ